MASIGNEKHEGEFEFASLNSPTASLVPNGLSKINTKVPAIAQREVCKDDTSRPVKVANVDELHALQQKKASAPSTPRNSTNPSTPKGGLTPKGPLTPRSYMSEEERHSQQMHSIR